MNIKVLVGQRIKELRIKSGYTQAELAEIVSIDPKHQSCIETGRNFPSADLIDKYAIALNIDTVDILNLRHIKSRQSLENDIISAIKKVDDKKIILIHRLIFDVIK